MPCGPMVKFPFFQMVYFHIGISFFKSGSGNEPLQIFPSSIHYNNTLQGHGLFFQAVQQPEQSFPRLICGNDYIHFHTSTPLSELALADRPITVPPIQSSIPLQIKAGCLLYACPNDYFISVQFLKKGSPKAPLLSPSLPKDASFISVNIVPYRTVFSDYTLLHCPSPYNLHLQTGTDAARQRYLPDWWVSHMRHMRLH